MKLVFAGGLNELQTPSLIECIKGYNFELGLKQSKLIPRAPFDLKGTATNAGAINGFMQLVKRDNTETTLVQAGSVVYQWDGSSTFTSKATGISTSTRFRDTYWSLGDYLVITDTAKATVVKKWDGTTFSSLTTGLGTSLYAKYGAVKDGRVWLANVTTSTDTPHLLVASAFENPQSYDTSVRGGPTTSGGGSFSTGQEAFYLLTPDLKPINGMVEFHNQLIISTEGGRLYLLEGTSASTYKLVDFYKGSAATGTESIANIGNDVIYMKQGGGIDLLTSIQQYGDVRADDISRFIQTTVKDQTGAIVIYDQKNQKVLFFLSDRVLVLFKDLLGSEYSPWSVYTTQQSFNFATNAAKYMKMPGTQVYSVYFGDSVGRIFDLNGTGTSGDAGSSTIAVLRKTRFIYNGEGASQQGQGGINFAKRTPHGLLTYRRVSTGCNCTISFDWGDEYNESSSVVPIPGAPTGFTSVYYNGSGYYNGTASVAFYYSQGGAFSQKISSQTFSPAGRGPGCFISVSLDTASPFQIDSLEVN